MVTHSFTESRTLLCALEEKIGRERFCEWIIDAVEEYKSSPLYSGHILVDYIVDATDKRYRLVKDLFHPVTGTTHPTL